MLVEAVLIPVGLSKNGEQNAYSVYNMTSGAWSAPKLDPSFPFAQGLYGQCAVLTNGKVYVFGGSDVKGGEKSAFFSFALTSVCFHSIPSETHVRALLRRRYSIRTPCRQIIKF